jgi:hypothetical protein
MYVNDYFDTYGQGLGDIIPGIRRGISQLKIGINPLESRPKEVDRLLNKYGDYKITGVRIMKSPIQKTITDLLNVASLFQLRKTLKKLNYDDLYHLYLNLYLENGEVIGLEKNQRLNIVYGGFNPKDSEAITIGFEKKPTLKSLIEHGERKGGANFYRYDAVYANCQKFVIDLIGNLIPEETKEWIMQDIEKVVPSLYRNIVKTITDVAAVGDYLWKGGKKNN